MHTNLIFDQPAASLPTGFVNAAEYAAGQVDGIVASNFTANIDVGYGKIAESPMFVDALGESLPNILTAMSYTDLLAQLTAHAGNAADRQEIATLPKTAPPSTLLVTSCQMKAWGLQDPNASMLDGYVGISNQFPLTTNPVQRAVPSQYDLVGVFEHEITQVMGRLPYDGAEQLVTFSAPGRFAGPGAAARYFSTDGGKTDRHDFSSTGDQADWLNQNSNVPDSFNYITYPSVENDITAVDQTLMGTLGFALTSDTAQISHHHCHHDKMRFIEHNHKENTAGLPVAVSVDAEARFG